MQEWYWSVLITVYNDFNDLAGAPERDCDALVYSRLYPRSDLTANELRPPANLSSPTCLSILYLFVNSYCLSLSQDRQPSCRLFTLRSIPRALAHPLLILENHQRLVLGRNPCINGE